MNIYAYTAIVFAGVLGANSNAMAEGPPKPPASVVDAVWSDPVKESEGTEFSCPEGKVITGRRHKDDENGQTFYRCAGVTVGDEAATLQDIVWSTAWNNDDQNCDKISSRECNHTYVCPDNKVMVGRFHEGDEKGHTRYQCARVATAAGVFPEGYWHVIKSEDDGGTGESNHEFLCPDGTVMTGRYHKGDENGETGYSCGYLIPGPTTSSGTIGIRQKDGLQPCAFALPSDSQGTTWTYSLPVLHVEGEDKPDKINPCGGQTAESLEMMNAPSAAKILLTADVLCQKKGDFWIELLTNRKSVSLEALQLPEILKTAKGQVVTNAKGLVLMDYFHNQNSQLIRALSCIQVTTSAAVPQ